MSQVLDPRRWVAFKAHGAARMMIGVQACLEDVEGALLCGHVEAAMFQARSTVLRSLSILSLGRIEGEVMEPTELDQLNFNPFAGLDSDLVDRWLGFPRRILFATTQDERTAWLSELVGLLSMVERELAFDPPLEVLRSARGLSGILAVARHWEPQLTRFGIPSAFPREWQSKPNPTKGARTR